MALPTVRRLRRCNIVAGVAFTIGGTLFALGAWVAQIGSGDATTAASIYFAGGPFFNTGAYATLLLADALLSDLRRAVENDLSKLPAPPPISRPQGFHH